MKLILRREKPQPDELCTLGFLFIPGELALVTMERPWIPAGQAGDLGGKKNLSCVPLGTYRLVPHESKKHGRTWALVNHELDVVHFEGDDHDPDEDRATCLLHVCNYVTEIEGCIGVGTRAGHSPPDHVCRYMVSDSRRAMNILRSHLNWPSEHTLEIVEAT
jgi:hypothetical protein